MTEREQYNCLGKTVKVTCVDNMIIEGLAELFTKAIDNEPEIASIDIKQENNDTSYVVLYANEIKKIEYID